MREIAKRKKVLLRAPVSPKHEIPLSLFLSFLLLLVTLSRVRKIAPESYTLSNCLGISPTCFRRCADIVVGLKFIILFFKFYRDMKEA